MLDRGLGVGAGEPNATFESPQPLRVLVVKFFLPPITKMRRKQREKGPKPSTTGHGTAAAAAPANEHDAFGRTPHDHTGGRAHAENTA